MNKAERNALLSGSFFKQEFLDGNPPSILWKHRTLPNLYAFTSEHETNSGNEIIFVKSKENKLNEACKYAAKHTYQTREQLEVILTSLMPASQKFTIPSDDYKREPVINRSYQPQEPFSKPSYVGYERKSKRKGYLALAIIASILLVAILTNPSVNDHREAVKEKFLQEYSQESLRELTEISESGNEWSKAGAAIGYTLGTSIVERLIPSFVYRSNFLLFSFTEVHYEAKEKTIGIGLFGNVWIGDFNSHDISQLSD